MRIVLATVALAVLGCATEKAKDPVRSEGRRDLTLPAVAPPVELASALELEPPKKSVTAVGRPTKVIRLRQARPKPAKILPPAPALTVIRKPSAPVADSGAAPASPASPLSDRELLPGRTVTVIPASSGPSVTSEPEDFAAPRTGTVMVGGGGTCPPRRPGRGIGIGLRGPRFR